jgi:F-type H+-transporting ATPase subunit b
MVIARSDAMSRQCGIGMLVVAVLILMLGPAPAWAAGHGEEGAHEQPSIWAGGLHNVVWTLLIFLCVLFVLGKFAWGPLLGALQKREEFIQKSLEDAKRERQEAESLLKKYTEQIQQARKEASGIVDEGRRDAEAVRRKIEGEARESAEDIVKRAKRDIEIAHQHAIKQIYEEVADLSTRIAGQIIGREVNAEEHRRFVSQSLDEIQRQGGGSTN